MGAGFFAQSEGAFFESQNILQERDPQRITFVTLPDGDVGLRTPSGGGRIAEEQSIVALSDGSLYCVYRTIDGWPAYAYSRDRGRTWSQPEYATYAPGGRRVKHPRAANFVWKCGNGRYLYWFHNHGGAVAAQRPNWDPYEDRNPAWLMAGREVETPQGRVLCWSQPEIVLYDDDPLIRMSYPDLIEDGGPKIITFVVDGVLCDGGDERQFGWGRFSPTLQSVNGAPQLAIGIGVITLRIYHRPLRTSEAVGNYRAGCQR